MPKYRVTAFALLFILLAGLYGWEAYGYMSWYTITFAFFSGMAVISALLGVLLIILAVMEWKDAS